MSECESDYCRRRFFSQDIIHSKNIIDRLDLLDAALIFGIGFPPFRGGLLRYADKLGAKNVVERLTVRAQRHGDRFAPPRSLAEMSRDDLITQLVS